LGNFLRRLRLWFELENLLVVVDDRGMLGLSGLFYRLSVQDLGDSFPEFDVQEETKRHFRE
jgi:hypothetical protein